MEDVGLALRGFNQFLIPMTPEIHWGHMLQKPGDVGNRDRGNPTDVSCNQPSDTQ